MNRRRSCAPAGWFWVKLSTCQQRLRLVRVVFPRQFSSPALNGSTPGVPGPKHSKVRTKTQLVCNSTRGPQPRGPKHPSKIAWSTSLDCQVTCPDPCFSSLSNRAPMPCDYYTCAVDPAARQTGIILTLDT